MSGSTRATDGNREVIRIKCFDDRLPGCHRQISKTCEAKRTGTTIDTPTDGLVLEVFHHDFEIVGGVVTPTNGTRQHLDDGAGRQRTKGLTMAKRATKKTRRSSTIRCDSPRAAALSTLNVVFTTLERQLLATCASWCGESINEFTRQAAIARCVIETQKSSIREANIRRIPAQRTTEDEARANEMVASILSDTPTSTRITQLAEQLSSLLSADDDVV